MLDNILGLWGFVTDVKYSVFLHFSGVLKTSRGLGA